VKRLQKIINRILLVSILLNVCEPGYIAAANVNSVNIMNNKIFSKLALSSAVNKRGEVFYNSIQESVDEFVKNKNIDLESIKNLCEYIAGLGLTELQRLYYFNVLDDKLLRANLEKFGLKNRQEIARILGLSEDTVKNKEQYLEKNKKSLGLLDRIGRYIWSTNEPSFFEYALLKNEKIVVEDIDSEDKISIHRKEDEKGKITFQRSKGNRLFVNVLNDLMRAKRISEDTHNTFIMKQYDRYSSAFYDPRIEKEIDLFCGFCDEIIEDYNEWIISHKYALDEERESFLKEKFNEDNFYKYKLKMELEKEGVLLHINIFFNIFIFY